MNSLYMDAKKRISTLMMILEGALLLFEVDQEGKYFKCRPDGTYILASGAH